MQRFHLDSCVAIPPKVLETYKSLKTTRIRGTTSPQLYWAESANNIGLRDTPEGIQVSDMSKFALQKKMEAAGQPKVAVEFQDNLAPASKKLKMEEVQVLNSGLI